jgi:RNA polymerase sigma-70 factor (ECF subfamily)
VARDEGRSRLFLQAQHLLLGYLVALVRDPSDAEDLLQEVGVVALTRADAPTDPAKFAAWCRGIARNLALHHWRAQRRRAAMPSEAVLALVEQAYAEADVHRDAWERRRRALARCFAKLGAHARELLGLRYVDELSADEIARRKRKTGVSIRMKLMRVRRALLRCMDRVLQERPS